MPRISGAGEGSVGVGFSGSGLDVSSSPRTSPSSVKAKAEGVKTPRTVGEVYAIKGDGVPALEGPEDGGEPGPEAEKVRLLISPLIAVGEPAEMKR